MPLGSLLDQGKECLVQKLIPTVDDFGGVASEGEPVLVGSGNQVACPDLGFEAQAPTARERTHPSGLAQPRARLSLGGGALVGEECDKSTISECFVSGPNTDLVVEDRRFMEGSHVFQKQLPRSLVGCPCHSNGVFAEVVKNSGKPFPIAVVHREEEGGPARLGPRSRDVLKRRQIQLAPSARKEKEAFPEGVVKQPAWEIHGRGANPMR